MEFLANKAIAYDRESGNHYFAQVYMEDNNGFVTLKDPVIKCSDYIEFNKFKNGRVILGSKRLQYGERCNDLMLPSKYVVIEILNNNEPPEWASITAEDAKMRLECFKDEANDKCKLDKQQYIENLNDLKRFWYKLFNKI